MKLLTRGGSLCPNCGKCRYAEAVCEERVAKGRRFFLMGALVLPVAAKIESLAPIAAPPMFESTIVYGNMRLTFRTSLDTDGIWLAE